MQGKPATCILTSLLHAARLAAPHVHHSNVTVHTALACLDGVLFRRQAEGVEANGMQHVVALVPLQPRHNVCQKAAQ